MSDEDRTDTGEQETEEDRPREEAGPGEPEEEVAEPGPDEMPEVETDVFDMLRAAINLFAQEAWIALGVQARYGSTETKTDLRCARVAIDTTEMLVGMLDPEATEDERRELEQTLTNLRINFVRRQSKSEE